MTIKFVKKILEYSYNIQKLVFKKKHSKTWFTLENLKISNYYWKFEGLIKQYSTLWIRISLIGSLLLSIKMLEFKSLNHIYTKKKHFGILTLVVKFNYQEQMSYLLFYIKSYRMFKICIIILLLN